MAHLKTRETKHEPEERKTWKFRLTTMLYDSRSGRLCQRGYSEQAILDLCNFLDWMMYLPEEVERRLTSIRLLVRNGGLRLCSRDFNRPVFNDSGARSELIQQRLSSTLPLSTVSLLRGDR